MTLDADASDAAVPAGPRVWFLTAEEVAATRTKLAKLQQRATAKGFTGRIDLTAIPAALAGGRGDADLRAALAPHLAEAVTQAPLIRQALLAALTDPAGYQANLTAVLRGDTVAARHLGLAVSAIPAHQRLLADRQRAQAREQAAAVVEHVGTVGDKITLTGTVTIALRVDGYTHRSPDQVMLIIDCGSAVVKTTTAAAWAYQIKVGDPLTVTGTVKAHTEWRGLKQTVLTRPKKIDPSNLEPQAILEATPPTAAWPTPPSFHLDGAEAARSAGQLRAAPRSATLAR